MTRRLSHCEQLEGRTLFSLPPLGPPTLIREPIVITPTWTVNGTSADDAVSIRADDNWIYLTVNGVTTTGASWYFKKVVVNGNDGRDTLTVDPSVKCRVSFNGGLRNDTLIANPAGDSGPIDFSGGGALGGGRDVADFRGSTVDLNISLDDVANDGRKDTRISNIMSDVEEVFTGSGQDTIRATDGHNTFLHGGERNDNLTGGNGNDQLDGEGGNDWLIGGLGADKVHGGEGIDMISYIDREVPLTIKLNGQGGSGATGEDDTIHTDVENVIGGRMNDFIQALTILQKPHVFFGGAGDDFLDGGAGDCVYWPEGGNDTIQLSAGNNKVFAEDGMSAEHDTIRRSGGNDTIFRDFWDVVQTTP